MYLCQVVKTRAVGKGPEACLGWEQVAVVYTMAGTPSLIKCHLNKCQVNLGQGDHCRQREDYLRGAASFLFNDRLVFH